MSTQKWLIALAVALLLGQSNSFAEPPYFHFEEVTPDASQNEEKHSKAFTIERKLVKETIKYIDGSGKTIHYRDDGTTRAISTRTADEKHVVVTRFSQDGKTRETVTEFKPGFEGRLGAATEVTYHKDGKSPWATKEFAKPGASDNVVTYCDPVGKLIAKASNSGLNTETVFYDADGKQDYKQVWVEAIDGPYLLLVEEVTPSGVYRRVHFRGGVKKVEYLKTDGSVERVEEAEKGVLQLAEPVDPKHSECLKEPNISP